MSRIVIAPMGKALAMVAELAKDRKALAGGDIGIGSASLTARALVDGLTAASREADGSVPTYHSVKGTMVWPNGVVGRLISGSRPDSYRGLTLAVLWAPDLNTWPDYWVAMICVRCGPGLIICSTPLEVKP